MKKLLHRFLRGVFVSLAFGGALVAEDLGWANGSVSPNQVVATVGGAALTAAEMELAKAKAGEWQGVRKIKASVEQKHVGQARR